MNEPKYAYDSDRWWPDGLPEWIAERAATDPLFAALDRGLRSFGWPAYNVPRPLPYEDSWPGLALGLAQRVRDATAERSAEGASIASSPAGTRGDEKSGHVPAARFGATNRDVEPKDREEQRGTRGDEQR